VGSRVGGTIPKQFAEIKGAPVIAYTMSAFEKNSNIEKIVVVCVQGWEEKVKAIAEKYRITKFYGAVKGGRNSMESIKNGVFSLKDMDDDDLVIIHDSVRPVLEQHVISDCVFKARMYGNGCAAIPLQETMARTKDGISSTEDIDRSEIMRIQTPQAYRYRDIMSIYDEAEKKGITESVYTNTLALQLGRKIYFSEGSSFNVKITTPQDLKLMEMLLTLNMMETPKSQ